MAWAGSWRSYQYDEMGRLATMDDGATARATYGAAGG